jgi:hypothetical protein
MLDAWRARLVTDPSTFRPPLSTVARQHRRHASRRADRGRDTAELSPPFRLRNRRADRGRKTAELSPPFRLRNRRADRGQKAAGTGPRAIGPSHRAVVRAATPRRHASSAGRAGIEPASRAPPGGFWTAEAASPRRLLHRPSERSRSMARGRLGVRRRRGAVPPLRGRAVGAARRGPRAGRRHRAHARGTFAPGNRGSPQRSDRSPRRDAAKRHPMHLARPHAARPRRRRRAPRRRARARPSRGAADLRPQHDLRDARPPPGPPRRRRPALRPGDLLGVHHAGARPD